ncbi:MAG: galactitol-1-phosphate 5-dehydrogenase [Oscillospiraceae bacterium]|nr:galactitol-1-phosphate 5-dehydrogenase [Oscillospiraceae bacterium]
MKAAVLRANGDIRHEDYPKPELKPDYVMLKIMATGICGSDVPRALYGKAHNYPIVLGHEFSGEIVEIGENANGFEIGERASGAPLLPCMKCKDCQKGNYALCKNYTFIGSRIQGSFAEFVALPAANAVKFDNSVSFEQGALFEPATVALHGLKTNDFKGGGETAILGAGTIGIFTLQWAKIFGAKSVSVFDISNERLSLAKEFGADNVGNLETDEMENGKYDYIFETAGAANTMQNSFALAANKAHICFIGTPAKDLIFAPELFENMNRKEFRLTGSWMSYSAPFPGEEWLLTAHYFKTGQLKFNERFIFKKLPIGRAAEGFELYKTPGAVKGKIMLYNTDGGAICR